MSSQERAQSGDARHERFDNPEVGSGVHDTGTDAPETGSADRPVGTVDEDANPPMSDPSKSDVYGLDGRIAPARHRLCDPALRGSGTRRDEGTVKHRGSQRRERRWRRNGPRLRSQLQVGESGFDQWWRN